MTVKPVLGTNELELVPKLNDIKQIVSKCFMEMLEVTKDIPRLEAIIFPGICFLITTISAKEIFLQNLLSIPIFCVT